MHTRKILTLLLAMALLAALLLTGCGEAEGPKDPNLGTWNAVTASMLGFEMDIDEVFEEGLSLTLKEKGKCVLNLEGEDYRGKWKLEDGIFTLYDSSIEVSGPMADGMLTMENLMDSGVDIVFVQETVPAE